MTKKPNFWKCIMGVAVLALLFIGTLAVTRAPRTKAASVTSTATAPKPVVKAPRSMPPQGVLSIENVFEASDGDVENNRNPDPTNADDWNSINPPTVGSVPGPQQSISGPAGNALLRTFVNDEGANDRIFTTGASKDFLDINTAAQAGPTPAPTPGWQSTLGSVPDKDEIDQAYAAKYIDPATGDSLLVFGATRHATNGDSNIGFWFYQSPVGVDTTTGDFLGFHVNGDLLLLSAFTGGGGTSTIRILEWVGTKPGFPGTLDTLANRQARCSALGGTLDATGDVLCDITGPGTAGEAFVNKANTTAVWPYTTKGKSCGTNCIPVGASFEGGINLTDLGLAAECFSSFLVETRSSQSVSAVLKDFALGNFNTCVALSLTKTATDVCEGTATTYTYKVKNTGGVTANFTVTDDNETAPNYTNPNNIVIGGDDLDVGGDANCLPIIGSPTSFSLGPGVERTFICTRNKLAGTYTNTAQATGSFLGSTKSVVASATAHVFVNPAASAGNDQGVCDTAPHQFALSGSTATVPPGGSLKWTVVSGSATISDDSILHPNVTLNAFGSATLRITVKSAAGQAPQCPDAFDEITLSLGQNPAANAGPDLSACESTASHQFTISGSTASVPAGGQITWSGPAGVSFDDTHVLHPVVTVSAFGSFTLTMSVSNPSTGAGCNPASDTAKVTLNQNPVITIDDVACSADGTPQTTSISLTANVGAGSGTNTFAWTGPAGFANPGNVATINTSIPGLYTVTVTAAHADGSVSCQSSKSKFVGLCASNPKP